MAESLLKSIAGDRFEVYSAGTRPVAIRPEAVTVMKEVGIDISGNHSKHVNAFRHESFDYVLTVCSSVKETCPVYPRHTIQLHHSFDDPAAVQGSEEERLIAFRKVRDKILDYLLSFPSSK